jgi:hypothetical protein
MGPVVSATPGADELRMRALLVAREVGPDAAPPEPAIPPQSRRPQERASVMGYLILASLIFTTAVNWRAPASDARFLARMTAVLAVVLAVQMWWYL